MPGDFSYENMLRECLRGELRLVNTGLPLTQKPLSALLCEEHPHVVCTDGSVHLIKKRELEYCASITHPDEQEALLLPMLIEIGGASTEAAVVCRGQVEEKIASTVINMPVASEQGRLRLYKPQLALLRKALKTTTQYVFLSESLR